MKKIGTLFLVLTLSFTVINAQNSRAKILISSFDKQIGVANDALDQNFFKTAEGKIGSLERSLKSIKKKDPSFDTTSLEKKLDDLKDRCGANKDETLTKRANDKEQYYTNVKAKGKMDDYIRSSYLPREDADALSQIDFSQLDMDKYRIRMIEATRTSIERSGDDYLGVIDRHRVKVGNSYPGEAEKAYERFLDQKRYYDYAVKFFPGEPVLEKVQERFQSLFNELGDLENIKRTAKNNGTKELEAVEMPVASLSDTKIENLFKTAFDDESKNRKYDRTLIKINLLNRDWVMVRKEFTGVLLGRRRRAAISYKEIESGRCVMYESYQIYQQHNGSGFSNLTTGSSKMAGTEILCKNIN